MVKLYPPGWGSFFSPKSVDTDYLYVYNMYNLKATDLPFSKMTLATMKEVVDVPTL